MKILLASFLTIFISLSVFGQPDTLFLTIEQKKTFESILDSFQHRQMDINQIYTDNKRFDSLIRVIDKMNDSRRYKSEDLDILYQKAKKIYPYSWHVLHWENPVGCFFANDIIERTQERLRNYCDFCIQLRDPNEFGLTKNQLNQVHMKEMDNYIETLGFAFYFIDKNLEGRLWAHLYFAGLEKAHIVIFNE